MKRPTKSIVDGSNKIYIYIYNYSKFSEFEEKSEKPVGILVGEKSIALTWKANNNVLNKSNFPPQAG